MYALHEQDVVAFQLHGLAGEGAHSRHEIELGHVHLLAGQQVFELFVQELDVHGLKRFIVALPVLVERSVVAVYEVIVKLYHLRIEAQHPGLLCYAQRRTGLSARRRA